MSYTVLARKYRSRTFDDLVGQSAIATTLKNAVQSGRVHHGYLFTGTRGVGKTSAARVLAKSLNCLEFDAPTVTPCGECASCKPVSEGEDLDVIEIDAASHTGVENIRDLRDNVSYRPARSRFKVYIIDEVHMLSTSAFNALLKTLEEPPDHVKFILATTEIQKVPATIISRCQRFDFRSISPDEIAEHLGKILKQEGLTFDEIAIRRIARLANGSMRDALSLLDQVISFGQERLTAELLDDVLPPAHDDTVTAMFDDVAENNAASALQRIEQCLGRGQTIERFCELVITHLHSLMLLNVCGGDTDLVDVSGGIRDQLVTQSQRFDAATFVYMISLMEEVRRSVKSSNASRALVDAAVVRLAMARQFTEIGALIERLDSGDDPPVSLKAPPQLVARPTTTPSTDPPSPSRRTPDVPSSSHAIGSANEMPTASQESRPRAVGSSAGSSLSAAEQAKVRRDPDVQIAMDLFGGTLAEVRKVESSEPGVNSVRDDDVANDTNPHSPNVGA